MKHIDQNSLPRYISMSLQKPISNDDLQNRDPNLSWFEVQKILDMDAKFVINDFFVVVFIENFNLQVYNKFSLQSAIIKTKPADFKTKKFMDSIIEPTACIGTDEK